MFPSYFGFVGRRSAPSFSGPIPDFDLTPYKYGSSTDNIVLQLGAGGSWDDEKILHPCVVSQGGVVYLFYGAYDGADWAIGVANASESGFNGLGFTKYASNPILSKGAGGAWDNAGVYHPYVIYDGTWKMWYAGTNGTLVKIGYATASNPTGPWTKHGSNPLLSINTTWEGNNVMLPGVLKETAGTSPFDTTSLISWWGFNETGGNRIDSHGTNHLTAYNSVASRTGKSKNAGELNYNGTPSLSGYYDVADNSSLQTGDIDFSVAGWFYIDSVVSGNRQIVAKDVDSTHREWRLDYNSTTLRFFVFDSGGSVVGTVNSGVTLSADTWYHVVAWHDSVNNQVGIAVNDGTPVTAATTGAPGVSSGTQVSFGRYLTAFDGAVDEWLFTKRILTSGERTWLYNSGNGRSYSEIMIAASYKMLYTGNDPSTSGQIGFAVSDDGITWRKFSGPILSPFGSTWEGNSVFSSRTLTQSGGAYYIYYSGKNSVGGLSKSGYAYASDFLTWTRGANNPTLYYTRTWEETGANKETENMFYISIGSNAYIYYDAYFGTPATIGVVIVPL